MKAKSPAGIWLETHFGWAPLIEDIANSMELLEADFKPRHLYATARGKFPTVQYRRDDPTTADGGNGHDWNLWNITHDREVRCRMGADVRISNPNLLLANRMGFINPYAVVNELVPFSFVADWFSNWSQWLGAYSEFYGLELANPYHTVYVRKQSKYHSEGHVYGFGSPPPHWENIGNISTNGSIEHVYMERVIGIPEVTLGIRLPAKLSLVRAATAASLLTQVLSSNGYDPKRLRGRL